MLLSIADKTAIDNNSAQLSRSWLHLFLKKFKIASKQPYNFTSAAKPLGSFMVPADKQDELYRLYEDALQKGLQPHLTEKPGPAAPLVVDIDLRYPVQTSERRFSFQQIKDVASAYVSALSQHVELSDQNAMCYIFERSAPYVFYKKEQPAYVKDGWHMMFPFLHCTVALKLHVRELVLKSAASVLQSLGATNPLEDIVDRAVIDRNNWYVYGSGKPGLEPYQLTSILDRNGDLQPIQSTSNLPRLLSVAIESPNVELRTPFPEQMITAPKKPRRQETQAPEDIPSSEEVPMEMLAAVIDGLKPFRCCNRTSWIEIIWAIYNVSYANHYLLEGLKLAHQFSEKDPDAYDQQGVEKEWKDAQYRPDGKKFGSLCHMLEEDDPGLLRQIRTPKKDYKSLKLEFEVTHFKLLTPAGYVLCDEHGLFPKSKRELLENYENLYFWAPEQQEGKKKASEKPKLVKSQFLPKWFADETIRTYRTMDFLPPPQTCPADVFNLFTGIRAATLSCESQDVCLEPVWDLHRRLCGNDANVESYSLNWLAHLVQMPGELSRVALLWQSDEGTGKGMFLNFLGNAILGSQYFYSTTNPADLFDTFAVGLKHKLLVNLNEVDPQTANKYTERLKSAITDATINYQAKYVMSMTISNFSRWILSTNNRRAIKASVSDRRFVAVECDNCLRNNSEYFGPLSNLLKDDRVAKAFYDCLLLRDISGWDATRRPMTSLYRDLKMASVPILSRWLASLVEAKANLVKMSATSLLTQYKDWCKQNGFEVTAQQSNSTNFGTDIKKYGGVVQKKIQGIKGYHIDWRILQTWLVDNQHLQPDDLDWIDESDEE